MTSTPPENDKRTYLVFDIENQHETPKVKPVTPEIARRLTDAYKSNTSTMTSHPPHDDWSAEDLANQRRVNAEINKALERMYIRMVVAIGAVAALLATAIHFLGKQ